MQTIAPLSALPAITQAVLIDGFSQPGYTGTPLIELSGSQAGAVDGLTITGANVTVRGLDIGGFSQGAGIHLTGTGVTGDWIYGNFLGTDPTGTQACPTTWRRDRRGSDQEPGRDQWRRGERCERAEPAQRQLVCRRLDHRARHDSNAVAGNWIGTDISGSIALNNGTQPVCDFLGNVFGGGVAILAGASGNRIGTDGKSVDDVGERNVIAGSNNDAIDIYGSGTDGNVVAGNFIGTDVTGTHSLGIAGDGIFLAEGASRTGSGSTRRWPGSR